MAWLQLHVTVRARQAGQLETLLETLGAHSVTLCDSGDQPILEPGVGETPLWPVIRASALFDAGIDTDALLKNVQSRLGSEGLDCNIEHLEDRVWEREWLQHFAPIRCGERLWICPGGEPPPDPDAVNLLLDPGLAFGTGTHETTRLCLNWLDRACAVDQRVLDFGCGSGILGIAALLLGARHATFSDNDPQALQATASNLARNAQSPANFHICDAQDFKRPEGRGFDIVLANILARPLIELAPLLARSVAPRGRIVLSGLRAEQADDVQAAYTST
ncbi:MAG: 50S ribosomal protein L11 methyltransferase, partial [Pseudomonadales bacterium]